MNTKILKVLHQVCVKKATEGKYHGNTKALAKFFKINNEDVVSLLKELEVRKLVKLYLFDSEYFILEILPSSNGVVFDIRFPFFGLNPGFI